MSSSSSVVSEIPKEYRLNAKDLFLTYPQCDVDPNELLRNLQSLLKHFAFAAVSCELHESGDPHRHAIVHLSERCDFSSPNCLDIHDGRGRDFHGNYQSARSAGDVLRYVEKDGEVVTCGATLEDIRTFYGRKTGSRGAGSGGAGPSAKRQRLGEILRLYNSGTSWTSICANEDLAHMAVLHMEKVIKMKHMMDVEQALALALTFLSITPEQGGLPALEISTWLNKNLLRPRVFGQRQLYIHGPTMHGKTSLVMLLITCMRCYFLPDEDFYDDFDETKYDLIIYDESKTQKTITWWNKFLDGQPCPLRQKGRQTMKKKNLPVIVLSNYSLKEAYHIAEEHHLASLERRFQIVTLTSPIRFALTTVPAMPTVLDVGSSKESAQVPISGQES